MGTPPLPSVPLSPQISKFREIRGKKQQLQSFPDNYLYWEKEKKSFFKQQDLWGEVPETPHFAHV